jgi:protoheme ferro-lyase
MEKLNKAIEKIKNSDLDDKMKEVVIEHLKEWYNEKKSIAYLEEKIEEAWEKVLPILNELGLI